MQRVLSRLNEQDVIHALEQRSEFVGYVGTSLRVCESFGVNEYVMIVWRCPFRAERASNANPGDQRRQQSPPLSLCISREPTDRSHEFLAATGRFSNQPSNRPA